MLVQRRPGQWMSDAIWRGHAGSAGGVRAAAAQLLVQLRTDPLLVVCDLLAVAVAYATALLLRFDGEAPAYYWLHLAPYTAVAGAAYVLLLARAGLYARVWAQAGVAEAWWLAVTGCTATTVLVVLDLVPLPGSTRPLPVSVPLNAGLLIVLLLAVSRFQVRVREQRDLDAPLEGDGVVVIGAPRAARAAVERMRGEPHAQLRPVVIVTDDARAWHRHLAGVPVVGPVSMLEDFVGRY